MKVWLLGCGSPGGVPTVGNVGGDCDPTNPKNRRRRPSVMVEARGTRVLVDTSPDMREQLLAAGVGRIDGVIYTHAHADHLHGIDDLRAFWLESQRLVDIYADDPTADRIEEGFSYCLKTAPGGDYPAGRARGAGDAPEVVAGRNAVLEALRAAVPATALYAGQRVDADERVREVITLAARAGIPMIEAGRAELDRLTGRPVH